VRSARLEDASGVDVRDEDLGRGEFAGLGRLALRADAMMPVENRRRDSGLPQ